MSYTRSCWCLRSESNQRHVDFQSTALPTELQRHILEQSRSSALNLATPNGLEPSTSSVTGWRANRLHHRAISHRCISATSCIIHWRSPFVNTFFHNFQKYRGEGLPSPKAGITYCSRRRTPQDGEWMRSGGTRHAWWR